MKGIITLKKEVLASIKPKIKDTKTVTTVVKNINKALKLNEIKAECVIGGSFAKDTNLDKDFDVDLFVRFDYNKYLSADKKGQLSAVIFSLNP